MGDGVPGAKNKERMLAAGGLESEQIVWTRSSCHIGTLRGYRAVRTDSIDITDSTAPQNTPGKSRPSPPQEYGISSVTRMQYPASSDVGQSLAVLTSGSC